MADTPQPAAPQPAPPANGVAINSPAPAAAAPAVAAPAVAPAKEPFFKGFDWWKVLAYSVLVIVGVSYVKYTRDKATKDSTDIANLKSQLSSLQAQVDEATSPPATS